MGMFRWETACIAQLGIPDLAVRMGASATKSGNVDAFWNDTGLAAISGIGS